MPLIEHTLPEIDSLFVLDFGEEKCAPAHSYGPAARGYYLIHYVASGQGELTAEGRSWPVRAGQGFLIYPGEVTAYRADSACPWHYSWVGYAGEAAERVTQLTGFSRNKRVLTAPRAEDAWNALVQLRRDASVLRLGQLAALGGLYRFLTLLAQERDENAMPDQDRYYEKALWYMRGAYARSVTVQEIADFVGLSRSQLFRVFEKSCGQSPKEALQEMRLEEARLLLRTTTLPMGQVALSCGLNTSAQLSAAFRSRYGFSPREYRKNPGPAQVTRIGTAEPGKET